MIGKVTIGKSFGGVVRYIMEKEGAEVLEQSGVRAINPILAIQDFNAIRIQRPGIKNAVWHTTLSFAYQDTVSSEQMIHISKDYLKTIGLDENQFLMAGHYDTKHQHIHIISNRIGFYGQVVSDQWCKNRTANICDQLEEKYGLIVARCQGKEKLIG
ncbi:MAG: relaxase/mobilization nuclease domain-containing protein [Bacteroidetes bacterium]|nr:relaxase/mobilization nuclease domain-containing protein [Bacteroidota bacterium]